MSNTNYKRWNYHSQIDFEPCEPGVRRKILSYGEDLMCVENHFQSGAEGNLHSHPHTQISYAVSGKFIYHVDGEEKEISTGDSVLIPGGLIHGVRCLEAGIILDSFTPMRQDFL